MIYLLCLFLFQPIIAMDKIKYTFQEDEPEKIEITPKKKKITRKQAKEIKKLTNQILTLMASQQTNRLEKKLAEAPKCYLKEISVYEGVPYGTATVQLLVQYGASVNICESKEGWSPLMRAAATNNVAMTNYLLKQAANINQQDHVGSTALIEATRNLLPKIVEILLEHKADLTICDDSGKTALDIIQNIVADTDEKEKIENLLVQYSK